MIQICETRAISSNESEFGYLVPLIKASHKIYVKAIRQTIRTIMHFNGRIREGKEFLSNLNFTQGKQTESTIMFQPRLL